MELYDTHAHFGPQAADTGKALARAQEAGVTRLMAVGGSAELNAAAVKARAMRPDAVRLALGADRDQAALPPEELLAEIRRQHAGRSCAAVGEIGLDFHYAPETSAAQCALFAAQLALADELNLPVVVHTRDADDATCGVLDEIPWHSSSLRGVIHCYTGAPVFARKLLDRGFMVSFSGIVTFRRADEVRASAKYVPDDRLLIETDSPYLAPVPMRGQANEPAFVVHTARFLADLRRVSVERLAAVTFANAVGLFG
ncbi:MAG: TatD family hydrolase [Kiritimatiellae bacterium]|nr:TatD family hydrolase [Kiritimatiellia bacterium]